LNGWHDGYCRLSGAPKHYREFTWDVSRKLLVKDIIFSGKAVQAISRIHLHPDCTIENMGDTCVILNFGGGKFKIEFSGVGKLYAEDSFYCPEFNTKLSNTALAYNFSGRRAEITYLIQLIE